MPTTTNKWQFAWEALDANHLRPLITNSSPSRSIRVVKLTGSEDATSGSVMANAEPISPSSNGTNQRCFCSGVANNCSNSIFGTSGAWQLNTRDAHSRRPKTSATPVNSRFDNLSPGSSSVSRGSAIFHSPNAFASARKVFSISGVACPSAPC